MTRSAHLRTLISALAVGFGLILTSAPAALANSYTVYGCQYPGGAKAPMVSWQGRLDPADNTAHEFWGGTCPGPWYLKLDPFWSHIDGAYAEATFIAPVDTTIASYSIWRAVRLVPSAGYVYQTFALSAGRWVLMDGCTGDNACGTYGNINNLADRSNLLHQSAPVDTTELQLKVMCVRSGGCPSVGTDKTASDAVWMWSSAVVVADNFSPQFVGPPSGPLVSPGVLSGVVPVTVGATDRGGGIYRAMIEVDGRVLVSQSLGGGSSCKAPFASVVPCELSASGTLALNTAALQDGKHSVRLLVSDAAGNTAAWGPITITTVNRAAKTTPTAPRPPGSPAAPGSPASPGASSQCRPAPAVGGLDMHAAFEIVKHERVRVHKRTHRVTHVRFMGAVTSGYRHPPVVVGTVKTAAGAPLGAAAVCVAARDDNPGAPFTQLGTIATNAAGAFRYHPRVGPSRTLYFIHRVGGGAAIYKTVHIAVRVPVKVHVNAHHLRNGQVMTLRGRLPGPVPDGLLALLQVWRGTYWQAFEQVSVRRTGAWVGRYRFTRTTGVQHYRFRVKIPKQSGYPYAADASQTIHMTVVG